MSRTINIAAVQMDAEPAPTAERLSRAESFVAEAAGNGAQLVVLPEVFNTGYEYSDENYQRAERIDGPTVSWMRKMAAEYGVHLAGTLLLLDEEDIYNAMLLVAPDGRHWRYDKNYPWFWERAYFREGRDITVADTSLGKLGMMICWDTAHPELWARYAGKVDAMVVCSCPPMPHQFTVVFPDGQRLTMDDAGPMIQYARRHGDKTFGELLRRQAVNLGVPVVNTTGSGVFSSSVPSPQVSLATYVLASPEHWRYLAQADDIRIETGYFNETYVADAYGNVLAQVPGGEGYALAEVALADTQPQLQGPQPRFGISRLAHLLFDTVGSALMIPVYRQAIRRVHGERMAPISIQTRSWLGALTLASIFAYLVGRAGGRKRE